MNKKTLVVIGGGAAGFFCAINAAAFNHDIEIVIIEKSTKLLSKVKVSGGGRCNVTHSCFSIAEMIKNYPRGEKFIKKTFHQFFTTDTINWFGKRSVQLKTEADGRMFPVTNSSQTIIDCLMKEVKKHGIQVLMNREVTKLSMVKSQWSIEFAKDEKIVADYVCVASGGFAKTIQFNWLKELGHSIEEPVPSLFTFNIPADPIKNLMGISVEKAVIKILGTKFSQQGRLLITHWGLSGPAVLKLSAFAAKELHKANYDFKINVNWLPLFNEQTLKQKFLQVRNEHASQKIVNRNPFFLPQRLWEYLLQQAAINENIRWADLPAKQQNILIKILCAQEFHVKGKTTFKEEFVTSGGIKLNEIDTNTMQSKIVSNLFFAGEVMDVDAITGGFNFQHAWTSGWIAGKAIGESNTGLD
ncbi:MAG TPA: NAD(P)/FAD-dependent oxidoreductase [Chitinophagaceae bacterium]|nr:NAD(P)/FAD-dependent oxidoreductase [Chitinophagaceae bacterium]